VKIILRSIVAALVVGFALEKAAGQEAEVLRQLPMALPEPPVPASECARWRVLYLDNNLGVIAGDAIIYQRGVFGKFGYDIFSYRMSAQGSPPAETDPHFKIDLNCDGPFSSVPDVWPPPGRPLLLGGVTELKGAGNAEVKIERDEKKFAFAAPSPVPTGTKQQIDLVIDDDGDMVGRWSYPADPVTQRGGDGNGRSGHFSMAADGSFGGRQSGSEIWIQTAPEIEDAVVLDNQLEIPHYFSGGPERNRQRALFVVGRNLTISVV